ncbi:MAG: transporter substrate-binding domain-containing protein [Promethearchaeota archaeon]
MKREFAVVGIVAAVAVGLLVGWFIPSPLVEDTSRTPLLDTIISRGYIKIGTSADYPPFEFVNISTSEIEGFDPDVCGWIADELGVTIQWSDQSFGGLIASCAAGNLDMVAAAMTYNDNRSSYLAASVSYISVGQAVVVRNDSVLTITGLSDLVGETVGAQLGTTLHADLVAAGVTPVGHVTVDALMLDLIGGGVDVVYIDLPVYTVWTRTYNLKVILEAGVEEFALWTRYGEPELLYEINNVILDSFIDGRMQDNLAKWLNITT